MKITDVALTLFAWEGIPATRYGRHTGRFEGRSRLGLLELSTDDGPVGRAFLGSAYHGAHHDGPALIEHLKPILMGQDPLERERLHQAMLKRVRSTGWRALGAADVALWDLGAQAAGLPLYRYIGACRESVPAYASSAVLDSPEAYAEEALAFRARGWRAYKIHPPTEPATDVAICRAVRKAVGDDYALMLDSTWSYKFDAALRVGKAVEELGFLWYEDPLADDDLYGSVKLKQALRIPLLATEYPQAGLTAYAPWIVNRATDYLRGDVAVKGGLTTLLKTAHLAEAFHMNLEVHHGGNSLNNVANLHLICAIANCDWFEVLLPDAAQKYGLAEDIEVGADGLVRPPQKPGLGAEIDFGLIERMKLATLS